MQPSPVVTLNRAVAVSKVRGPADALAMIEPLAPKLGGYCHGARGAFLLELGRPEDARVAFDRAIALANTPAEAAQYPEPYRPADRRRRAPTGIRPEDAFIDLCRCLEPSAIERTRLRSSVGSVRRGSS